MTLYSDWKRILRKAWSIRFSALSSLLSGSLIVFPMWYESMSRTTFAVLFLILSVSAGVARVVFQKDV